MTPTRASKLGRRAAAALLATTMLTGVAWQQGAGAAPKDKSSVHDWDTGDPVVGAFSQLARSEDGIATKVRTLAEPGHAYTMWYVIFNVPEECGTSPCGEPDLFVPDVRASVVYAGGGVANAAGRLKIDGGLAVGEVPSGDFQVVIGLDEDGSLFPQAVTGAVTTGLEDAMGAEVHLVLLTHGEAFEDAEDLEKQVTEFGSTELEVNLESCNPDCFDFQFAVHQP